MFTIYIPGEAPITVHNRVLALAIAREAQALSPMRDVMVSIPGQTLRTINETTDLASRGMVDWTAAARTALAPIG